MTGLKTAGFSRTGAAELSSRRAAGDAQRHDSSATSHDSVPSVHLFCGAGGDALGFREAGFDPILGVNHAEPAVQTWEKNFRRDGLVADINNLDMRRLPHARVLFGSPICTEGSPAGGNQTPQTQLSLGDDEGHASPATWERTRATAWDLIRAAEIHKYDAVCGENVVDFATRWILFPVWIKAWQVLGYDTQIVSVNAAHLAGPNNIAAAQDRHRILFAFTRNGIPRPDLTVRPHSHCTECGPVQGLQHWRNPKGRKVGRYGSQYDFVCPNRQCGHRRVQPHTEAVRSVIANDWTGHFIGDRHPITKLPYAANTCRRIQVGIDRYAPSDYMTILRKNCTVQSLDGPTATITTARHHLLTRPAETVDGCEVRILTPHERARVQRFPRSWELCGNPTEQGIQVGNAVPVNAAHWLGERVRAVLS